MLKFQNYLYDWIKGQSMKDVEDRKEQRPGHKRPSSILEMNRKWTVKLGCGQGAIVNRFFFYNSAGSGYQ